MTTSSRPTAKRCVLPRLTIDASMDYRTCSRSVGSLSYSTSTADSSSIRSGSSGVSQLVRGLYDFDGSGAEQLSFQSGEVLEVIYRDSSGWWAAHREDDSFIGWIPADYVEPLSRTGSHQSADTPAVWTGTPDSVSSTHSDLLAHYLNHPLVASPGHILSPESIGTRSKAIPRRTVSILGPHEILGFELPPSPLPKDFEHPSFEYSSPPGARMSGLASESPSTHEHAWSLSSPDIVKLCPSSPSFPPPPPPTPQVATLRREHSPEDVVFADPMRLTSSAVDFLATSPDSYAACHPQCAHRRLVRLEDGLYFRPLSVLVETMSIDSSQTEQDEQDSPDSDFPIESPSERSHSFDSSSRRVNKIRQITGDDVAQAVHDGKLAQASCPWYLRPICGEEEIRYDYNGSVAAGTLPALVETLASEPLHPSLDAQLRHTFFSTFRTMGTSAEVYDLLLHNFRLDQPLGLTGAEADDWKMKRLYPTQRRVLSVFTTWLVGHRMIEDDPPVARQLQEFLPSVTAPAEIAAAAQEVMDTLKRLTFAVPPGPTTAGTPQKRRKIKDSKHELLRMDPTVLAENLCLYESTLYSKIRPQECLERITTREGDSVANLLAFCSTHDRLASWVKHSILWTSSLNRRANVVDLWIKVAEKCHAMRNYSSMSAIATALSSSVITRLHLTWAHVNKTAHLTPLTQLNDPAGNFSAFRHVQRTCDLPCVPFIGLYLTDLMHINDQYVYRDTTVVTAEGPLPFFNFVKRRKWADVLDSIFRHRNKQYALPQDISTMSQIETRLGHAASLEQATFWAKSEEVQQEERASADLRRGLEAAGF